MRLVHSLSGLNIEMQENEINVIVVESAQLMAEYLTDLRKQLNGEDGQFVLSDKDICKIEKILEVIVDPWSIDFNSKRIKSKLLQIVKEEAEEYYYEEFLETKGAVCQYAEKVLDRMMYPVSYGVDIDVLSLFKFLDVKVDVQSERLLDTLMEYMKLLHDLCKIEVIVLVNIKTYLTAEEIQYLYQETIYQKINLILFEASLTTRMECEKITIIDADQCIINI